MDCSRRTVRRARALRRAMSLPEVLLWSALRRRPAGRRFRRQHPVGAYVLDFYCDAALLAVEVDGWSHALGDRPDRDARRDNWLASRGVFTLRLSAADVLSDVEAVAGEVIALALSRSPPLGGSTGRRPGRGAGGQDL